MMRSALMVIAVLCTISVPVLLAAALVRMFNKKSAAILIHGAVIMTVLAVSGFVLNSMLKMLEWIRLHAVKTRNEMWVNVHVQPISKLLRNSLIEAFKDLSGLDRMLNSLVNPPACSRFIMSSAWAEHNKIYMKKAPGRIRTGDLRITNARFSKFQHRKILLIISKSFVYKGFLPLFDLESIGVKRKKHKIFGL